MQPVVRSKRCQACDDSIEILHRQCVRQDEGEKREPRRRAHRGQIAQVHRERAMADRIGRHEPSIEMNAFDNRVDAQNLDAVPLRFNDRGVVADSDEQPGRRGREVSLYAGNELALGEVGDGRHLA